jgi:outer membrane lipoprotein SlyB
MKNARYFASAIGVTALLALGACADMNAPANNNSSVNSYPQSNNTNYSYSQYGVVQSIDLVRVDNANGNADAGVGTIAGAVIGGVVGHQIGGGNGNTAATVLGAVGGAYAGHELATRNQQFDAYRLTVRMRDGSYQTVTQTSNADIRVGDRVQIDNGVARRY